MIYFVRNRWLQMYFINKYFAALLFIDQFEAAPFDYHKVTVFFYNAQQKPKSIYAINQSNCVYVYLQLDQNHR